MDISKEMKDSNEGAVDLSVVLIQIHWTAAMENVCKSYR